MSSCNPGIAVKSSLAMLAGISALASVVAVQIESPAAAESLPRFSPPGAPFVLSRTLVRELSDGKQIVVTRSFRVQFVPSGNGFVLNGAPIGVTVEVPPILAKMAEIERQRTEPGPFPLRIDGFGRIEPSGPGEQADLNKREEMRRAGAGLLQSAQIPEAARRESLQALGALSGDLRSSPWPADLFSASTAERHLHRQVTLADGGLGEVDVVLRVSKRLPCGMPSQFERVITTDLSGTKRISREMFTLEPFPE